MARLPESHNLTFMDINLIYDANCYVPFILRMFWFNKYFDVPTGLFKCGPFTPRHKRDNPVLSRTKVLH